MDRQKILAYEQLLSRELGTPILRLMATEFLREIQRREQVVEAVKTLVEATKRVPPRPELVLALAQAMQLVLQDTGQWP